MRYSPTRWEGNKIRRKNFLESRPRLSVLFISGYANIDLDWAVIQEKGYSYLQKPFSPYDLLRAVKETIKRDRFKS